LLYRQSVNTFQKKTRHGNESKSTPLAVAWLRRNGAPSAYASHSIHRLWRKSANDERVTSAWTIQNNGTSLSGKMAPPSRSPGRKRAFDGEERFFITPRPGKLILGIGDTNKDNALLDESSDRPRQAYAPSALAHSDDPLLPFALYFPRWLDGLAFVSR
jgi:hypothetical protein